MTLTLTVLRCPPNVAPEVRAGDRRRVFHRSRPRKRLGAAGPGKAPVETALRHRLPPGDLAGRRHEHQRHLHQSRYIAAGKRPPRIFCKTGTESCSGEYEIEVGLAEAASDRPWGQLRRPAAGAGPFGNPFDDDIFAPVPTPPPAPRRLRPEQDRAPFSPRLPDYFDPLQPEEDVYPVNTGGSQPGSFGCDQPAAGAIGVAG